MKVMMESISASMLMLCNIIFFGKYPLQLTLSILHAIPKTGNLLLPTNFRGIQMQPIIALLYDRIIGNRLNTWAKICYEQSAFQKGKSTLNHIFTIRMLVALTKRSKRTLYIGFFDLSKAFDKVSRVLLMKSLVKMGIGSCLLQAIKEMYTVTRCVLKNGGKLSDVFRTYSGIKQGAPSSVTLFIIFMNDIAEILKEKCINEYIIGNLHTLLHADDTTVFSLDHDLFVKKCNVLLDTFQQKKLSLNLKKSSYMIIHAHNDTQKLDLKLSSGWLPYKSSTVYLGSIITDSGALHTDIKQHALNKGKNISIKLANFIYNNMNAPITVKNKVLNTCVNASILYSSETWSSSNLVDIETLHRKAIKTTFTMRRNTPNEIVYVESGHLPLQSTILKRQFKFWSKITKDIEENPDSPITILYQLAINARIPYIRHYTNLHQEFKDDNECFMFYERKLKAESEQRLYDEAIRDSDSIRGTYVGINPTLVCPTMYQIYTLNESHRMIMTKYRTGSHYLNVQKGRYTSTERGKRTCECNNGIQDIKHVIFQCTLTEKLRDENFRSNNLFEFFDDVQYAPIYLNMVEHILKLR